MKKLTMERGEGAIDFAKRLRKKFNSPEWKAKIREENFIQKWRYSKRKSSTAINKDKVFKSPGRN